MAINLDLEKYGAQFKAPVLLLADDKCRSFPLKYNAGSALSYHLKATVGAGSLEKFADADWKNFNREEILEIENDVKRPHPFEAAANALPADVKLDVAVDLTFSIQADDVSKSF